MTPVPLLSVVVVSRNDDHGGNLLYRMQMFVSGFLEQAKRYALSSELVIVEWNPPPDRPRLACRDPRRLTTVIIFPSLSPENSRALDMISFEDT